MISHAWRTSSVVISFGSALATSSTSAGPAVTASPEPSNTATRTNQDASRSQGRPGLGRTSALTACTRQCTAPSYMARRCAHRLKEGFRQAAQLAEADVTDDPLSVPPTQTAELVTEALRILAWREPASAAVDAGSGDDDQLPFCL
jgi:hypothetical protein